MTNQKLAKAMWDAYAIQANNKTFDGKPLPTWDELGGERQSCWVAAASATADRIEQLEIEKNRSYRNLTHAMKHIEKLEAALRHIELEAPRGSFFNDIARKALEGKDA